MYRLIRPLLFRLDAERAHHLTLSSLARAGDFPLTCKVISSFFDYSDPRLQVQAFGLTFKNPVGLAAGYDKDGVALRGLGALGFGHIEVGTLTRSLQVGNPRPRIHRVPQANALVNSMGFPNAGVEAFSARSISKNGFRLGINIGKSKDTPLERAADDYCYLFRQVYTRADYVALNVSSPNTPGLRDLQKRSAIEHLLRAVTRLRDSLQPRVPLLVKIAPDLTEADINNIIEAVVRCGVDGVIATNTTSSRGGTPDYAAGLKGGLSGGPLRERSTEIIRQIARATQSKLPIIGVGGISSAADVLEKLSAGARLVQIYTGLVYHGPGLIRQINKGLVEALDQAGATNMNELLESNAIGGS